MRCFYHRSMEKGLLSEMPPEPSFIRALRRILNDPAVNAFFSHSYARLPLRSWARMSEACRAGDDVTVTKALIKNSSLATATGPGNYTALHWAALHGHASCSQLLLNAGAVTDARDATGRTPLSLAAEEGHEEVRASPH